MTILVTGGTGFIGGHLIRRLLAKFAPSDVICLVMPPQSPKEHAGLAALRESGVRIINGDLNLPNVSNQPAPHVNIVFHLAANADTSGSDEALAVNDVGIEHLMTWLGGSVRGGRVVYTSSIAVLDRDKPAEAPLNELSPCVPRTAYGRTKLRGEQVIQREAVHREYEYTIFRLATVYGPGAKTDGLFDRLFKLTRRHSLVARLNWPGRTSIVHVDDVTKVLVELSQRREAANEIFCMANPVAPTVGALAESIASLSPDPSTQIELPPWLWAMGRRLAWSRAAQVVGTLVAQTAFWRLTLMLDDGFWFDTEKLQSVLNYAPKDLVEGLAEMLKYL